MPVFQPNAILGNSRSLITLGLSGEIMTFFYPHIDFPQNIQEGMPAIYFGEPGFGRFAWTYDDCFERKQYYEDRTNILITELRDKHTGLKLLITDFITPGHNIFAHKSDDTFVRQFELINETESLITGTMMQYLFFRLGETPRKNSARCLKDKNALVQYWRDICFAMGGDWPDMTQIGKAEHDNSAKNDMYDGWLNGQREELGDVDTAYGWRFHLNPGDSVKKVLFICAARDEIGALTSLNFANNAGYEKLHNDTADYWREWLGQGVKVNIEPDLKQIYDRSLLAVKLLFDDEYGSVLAAPEFDPQFERCGGYGFVWPRDAAEVALSLEESGYPELVSKFMKWAKKTQHECGYWDQRYWANGEVGPGWCSFLDSLQIDQIGSIITALGEHVDNIKGNKEKEKVIDEYWAMTENALTYLKSALGKDGLHMQAFDLWEKFKGSFSYSNASIWAGMKVGAKWAEMRNEKILAKKMNAIADKIKQVIMKECWNGEYFARGYGQDGKLDWQLDSSIVGIFDPFKMIDTDDPDELKIIEQMVATIRQRLTKHLPTGDAIIRHEYDDYVDGCAGGVNTLWIARVILRLAIKLKKTNPEKSKQYRDDAVKYMRTVITRGTTTGLLPELIGGSPTTPLWAVPHGWAMASYLTCCRLLSEVDN
jgi:oligosaccharide amylase